MKRTFNALNHLGNQRFILSPFSEQLNLWLTSLKNVLFEFESSPGIAVDEQFTKERSQIILNIELELKKRQDKEAHSGETAKNLSANKALLEQIEQEYRAAMKTFGKRKEAETKALSSHIKDIKGELERIAQMKTGILRRVSKITKAQKEAEARRRLEVVEGKLSKTVDRFNAEQEEVRIECETRKEAVSKQIQEDEKEILSQEIDDSLEARHVACEALVNTANSFLQRNRLL